MMWNRLGLVLCLGFAVTFLNGCGDSGPSRHEIKGKVTFKGEPIKAGTITFIPDVAGQMASAGGAPITNGEYSIPKVAGLPEGKYKVSISMPDPKNAPKMEETPGESVPTKDLIPAKYNSDTELRAEVTSSGTNEFNFDLK